MLTEYSTRPRLFGAKDIIEHLFDTYGPGAAEIPANLHSPTTSLTAGKHFVSVVMLLVVVHCGFTCFLFLFLCAGFLNGFLRNSGPLGSGGGVGGGGGGRLRVNARPDNNVNLCPLTLYGWEGNKYVAVVRQALAELSVPHILVHCAMGSTNR